MHKFLLYAAYGWLTLTGVLHFSIDVVSQHLRGKHAPGPQTALYDGLHSAFALGQGVLGALGLYIAWRALPLLGETPVMLIALAAGLAWMAIAVLYMPYWEPRFTAGVFCALVLAAWVTR